MMITMGSSNKSTDKILGLLPLPLEAIMVVHSCNWVTKSISPLATALAWSVLAFSGINLMEMHAAIADPLPVSIPISVETPTATVAQRTPPEIDTSITRDYEPVLIYIPDPTTQELVPQSMLVTADAPAVMAVSQIVDAYEGQDVGITGYEVNVNPQEREAEINFNLENPWGSDAFQSLSSANQYSLFEAIRETLLTQPVYGVDEIIFQANNIVFDI